MKTTKNQLERNRRAPSRKPVDPTSELARIARRNIRKALLGK